MPPSGTPPQSNEGQISTGNQEPYYSNEDVAILHDIVALAQELLPRLPERERLPTNALFNAYYDILPRLGLNADHDSRYARVLFKIGGLRAEGTLYERFEEVLARMGIEIEFANEDEEEFSPPEDSQDHIENATVGTTPPENEKVESKTHRRRNSESSFWDQGTPTAPQRRNSFSSAAQVAHQPGRPQFLQEIQPRQPPTSNPPPNHEFKENPQDNVGAWLNSHQERPRRRRGASVSTHSSLRIHRQPPSLVSRRYGHDLNPSIPPSDQYEASEDTAVTSALDYDTASTESLQGHRNQSQEPYDLMQIKAALFSRDQVNSVARRLLPVWREKAFQLREHHQALDERAVKHDTNVLLSISLASWQKLWLEHRQARDKKKFYLYLEWRATKDRDNHLMANCLQRWSDAAQYQVNRTAWARQHILRTRVFNAWAEITVSTEFKVRRRVLNKFFAVWRQRYASVSASNNHALQRYEDNLVEKTYWRWIDRRLDVKATTWWADGAKRRSLFNVVAAYHNTWEKHRTADEARQYRLAWNAWRMWRERMNEQARQNEQATEIYQTNICRRAFQKLHWEARIIPARNVVQSDVKHRMLQKTFDLWLHRTRQEKYAAEVDRAKILREAVNTWRYKLRSQRLRAMVNSRIKAQALKSMQEAYSLVLAERIDKEAWLRDIMRTWSEKTRALKEDRLQMENIAQSFRTQKSQRSILGQWVEETQVRREKESTALTVYQPRLLQKFVSQWSERRHQLQKLEDRSSDAKFYFLTTKSLKRWKASAEASKREKRKVAYTQVRRTLKINLATGVLENWRRQAHHMLDLQRQAETVRQNKVVVLGMNIFDRWRAQVAELAELEFSWREKRTKKYFSVWRERSSAYQALETEAVLTYQEKEKSRRFKKWEMVVLRLNAQTNYAYDIREKNSKRTFRKMLTYWRQKAALKRPPKIPEPEEPPDGLGVTARAETWSEYGDGAENDELGSEAVLSTPIPGYLRNAFVVLTGPDSILQTIYDDDDAQLEAIAIDEASGKIATCAGSNVRVYKPYGQGEDALKWSLQHSFSTEKSADDLVTTLSWGVAEELLVGGSWLALYSTTDEPKCAWKKELANPVKFANFSYDSAYIASSGKYDRLVKIWRRLSFGSDDTRYDFSYLPHPATVTAIHWRRPYHVDQTIDNVLYTICADNVLRIWAATDPHGLQLLQLWAQIDLKESIAPRDLAPAENSDIRFAFMIDGRDFMLATEYAVQARGANKEDHALSHLIEVANRSPEICVVLDGQGNMSAWGLENVGCKARQTTNIFNVAHVDGLNLGLPKNLADDSGYIQFYNYCNSASGGLNVLVHHFDGKIEVFESNVADLFDPSPRPDRFVSRAMWTGHASAIRKIVRSVSGRAVVTRTDGNEGIVWKHKDLKGGTSVLRQSIISEKEYIHRICVLREGNFVIYLHRDRVALWDTRSFKASLLASCNFSVEGKTLCILVLPGLKKESYIAHIATITSKMKGIVWEVRLPQMRGSISEMNGYHEASISEFCRFDLGESDDLSYVLPVDPAGSPPIISGFLDTFARDIAISYTHSGLLRSWTAKLDPVNNKFDWLETCSVDTGISEPALASGSSIRKAALVNSTRSELTIWDVRGAQLEYSQDYESQDTIRDLDWTSTPDDQSILAVGFQFRVLLLAQMRFDYLNKGPAWAAIREFNIRDLTPHPIGDSTWLSGGNLIIGAGNQIFVYDKAVDPSAPVVTTLGLPPHKAPWDLFEVVSRLNGPLPVYHPQFLGQCTLAGKTAVVQKVLIALYKTLKYYVEGESIDSHLGIDLEEFYSSSNTASSQSVSKISKSAFSNFSEEEEEVETVTEEVALSINEKLTKIALPQLTRQEQIHLADIVECVAIVEKQRRSMDDNAARFMLFFRQHALHRGRANEVHLSWREINWAYHSNSQDILVDMVSHQFHGKMLWEHARESGMFMWMTDSNALKAQFENIARNEYTKSDMKNPVDCTLFYLALKKKAVLQGLWRMASWNREQGATMRLLANNFQDKKWKTAALKNAYALLGKHRNEYAAAFFLLADHLKDAVNVILNQLKDLQLAIAVTRVYEGEGGPILKELLQDKVLPLAAQEGNRWLASWAFWMLHRRDMSVRALISPVYTLLETPQSPPDLQAKLFLTDDPALVVLYSQLRQKTLQTLRGASKVTPKVEWAFVLHNARLYDRMGCDLLALGLVRNWEFLLPTPPFQNLEHPDPRQMLRRRSSLVVADLPVQEIKPGVSGYKHKPPPTVFEEPQGSDLLDSFGF
ncbi:Regulator of V-ATPase in vacuolar membrane protein 1 [Lachnellula cervina]|uniref:Regulator of V-ATPase in vacuolar membrane protein 1 n=1 Tax=Lachnellula cervina TaxID=1316786 RepID=A0A7D8UXA0_9HELO|nr:Regulator of V-ATPase in vacuolar membrane protein 1 [Lachnellula cervina]